MPRNVSFSSVVLSILSKLPKLCGGKALKNVIEGWWRWWRGRRRGRLEWRKYAMFAKGFVASKRGRTSLRVVWGGH
jgi:hypothetical protein